MMPQLILQHIGSELALKISEELIHWGCALQSHINSPSDIGRIFLI